MKKMAPQSEQDLIFKLNQRFTSYKDLLNFFESNRDLFTEKGFSVFFEKLLIHRNLKEKDSKRPLDLVNETQFKMVMDDYNRVLGKQIEFIKKSRDRTAFYGEFLLSFKSIMGLYRGHRFNASLPSNVRVAYQYLLNDTNYLSMLPPSDIAFLMFANASPGLLGTSIKVSSLILLINRR